MKLVKSLFVICAFACGLSANTAWANHGSSHFVARQSFPAHHGGWHRPGWGWNVGFYGTWPWYYSPWYFGYAVPVLPATLYVDTPPPVQYIEMNQPANPPIDVQPNLWYYCSNPQGYYPYVRNCSTSWQSVPAQPPQQ